LFVLFCGLVVVVLHGKSQDTKVQRVNRLLAIKRSRDVAESARRIASNPRATDYWRWFGNDLLSTSKKYNNTDDVEELFISLNSFKDTDTIAHLPNLKTLVADVNFMPDLSFLRTLTNLEELVLRFRSGMPSLKTISALSHLRQLRISTI
jgi:hypothetical protein